MRDRLSRSTRTLAATGVPKGAPVLDWRTDVRPVLLGRLATLAKRIQWSPQLLDALLDELHVTEEFDQVVGLLGPAMRVHRDAAKRLGLALLLRRSWVPDDLTDLVCRLGLVPPSPTSSTNPRTATPADGGRRRRRQGRTPPPGPRA